MYAVENSFSILLILPRRRRFKIMHSERVKTNEHGLQCVTGIGFGFAPFLETCCGGLGTIALRFLMALAFLELSQYEDNRED
jgi:hypothetical protein